MTSYKCSSFNSLTGLFFLWLWTVKSGQKSRSAMVSSKDSASGRASFSTTSSSKLCNMTASFENKSHRFYKDINQEMFWWLNNFHPFFPPTGQKLKNHTFFWSVNVPYSTQHHSLVWLCLQSKEDSVVPDKKSLQHPLNSQLPCTMYWESSESFWNPIWLP